MWASGRGPYTFCHLLFINSLSNSSKSDYEKKLKALQNKRIRDLNTKSNTDDIELDEKNGEAINAYTNYMTEVISAFVFYSNPNANLELVLPAIKESANTIVKTTKFLLGVNCRDVFK